MYTIGSKSINSSYVYVVCKIPLLARRPARALGQKAKRVTIGYFVYNRTTFGYKNILLYRAQAKAYQIKLYRLGLALKLNCCYCPTMRHIIKIGRQSRPNSLYANNTSFSNKQGVNIFFRQNLISTIINK